MRNNVTTISNLPAGMDFISDSQDVDFVKERIGSCDIDFDACFVRIEDGEYTEIWGIAGIVPLLSKLAYKIHPKMQDHREGK